MIKICFKSFICTVLAISSFVLLERIYFHYTGAFSLSNIDFESTPFQPNPTFTQLNFSEKEKLSQIVNQKFSFLGKGNQTYAFLSADGKYVLKFFKFGHLKDSWYQSLFENGDVESRWKRFSKVFLGYELAFERNRENSGLLFIHLNKTHDLNLQVQVEDRLGFSHTIDLDTVVFVVQEKTVPAKEMFSDLLDQGDVESTKERLLQLYNLYASEYKNGIYDRDHNLMSNTGFTETRAIRFDVGKLRREPKMANPANAQEDWKKIVSQRLKPWFHKNYPQYDSEIEPLLNSLNMQKTL